MAKQPFFPKDIAGQILWLINFDDNLAPYAAKYGITPAQLAAVSADREYMVYWFQLHSETIPYMQGLTAFKNETAYGVAAGATASVAPTPPPAGTPPPAVDPGVFPRNLAIANAIKANINYTIGDGEVLKLEGAEIIPPNLNEALPELKLTKSTNQVEVKWGKQALPVDGIEIWVKRGAGNFVFLAIDTTTPSYTDTMVFPAVEETWTYKAVYFVGGGRVGQWSVEVSINVKA